MSMFQRRTKGSTEFLKSASSGRFFQTKETAEPEGEADQAPGDVKIPVEPATIINLLGYAGANNAPQIVKHLDWPKDTVDRFLNALEADHMIDRDDKGVFSLTDIGQRALKYTKIANF